MRIIIEHNNAPYFQKDIFDKVKFIDYDYQRHNGKKGSYWLTIIFEKGTTDFKDDICYIEIDPKKTVYYISN